MARGSRLAAGAREEHEVLPALGGSRKHGERRWDPERNRTRSGEGGSIHLRSKRRGTHSGRAAVLRTFPPAGLGPQDQSKAESRNDVLIFTTPAFAKDLEVTGPVLLDLYVSSSAVAKDFTGKAGRRVAERVRAKSYGGNPQIALSK